jgi:molybdopterin/thiamine biosynthesis adenylyltransferase
MTPDFSRQEALGVTPETLDRTITVVGAGGLGSPTVIGLAKTGFRRIRVVDFDKVEPHNIPTQFFGKDDVGLMKADALINKTLMFMPDPSAENEKNLMAVRDRVYNPDEFKHHLKDTDILVLAVDNHEARLAAIMAACEEREAGGRTRYVVDGRMNGFQHTVYNIDLDDEEQVKEYAESLFDDGMVNACVQPATFAEGMICSGRMVLEVLKRALEKEGKIVHPKFNTWEDNYNNIMTTERELFDRETD